MKKTHLILLLFPLIGIGQTATVIAVKTNDLVYSPVTNKIYVSVRSENDVNGNSISTINPQTALFENTFPIGTNPSVLAISADGNTIYSGFETLPEIKKFDLQANPVSTTIALGSDPETGDYLAEDIVILPEANTIAVSRRNKNFAPKHEGVVIFDNLMMRALSSKDHTGANQIELTSTGQLLGFNNETTESGIRKLTIGTAGITGVQVSKLDEISGKLTFKIYNDIAYFSNGKAVRNLATNPEIAGTFENAFGPMVYDAAANLICYASYNLLGSISLNRYNPTDYSLVDSYAISQANGIVKNIVACGNGIYALNTADEVIVVNRVLGTQQFEQNTTLLLHPNPATNVLNIDSDVNVLEISIFNTLGQLAKTYGNLSDKKNTVDISSLQTGTYYVKIKSETQEITKKLIKL